MGRMPVLPRLASFNPERCLPGSAWGITRRFHRLSPGWGLVAYALRTRAPLSLPRRGDPVRLACIRPAASVHPEPGSNSSLYYCCTFLFPVLGLRYDSLVPYSRNGLASRLTVSDFMLASSFQRTSQTSFLCILSPRCLGLQKYIKKLYAQAFFEKKIKKNEKKL